MRQVNWLLPTVLFVLLLAPGATLGVVESPLFFLLLLLALLAIPVFLLVRSRG